MIESFEQKEQWAREQFDAASKQKTDETAPQAITRIVVEFAAALGGAPHFVPVKPDKYGLFNWCSDGVLDKVKNDGGGIRFGWTVGNGPKSFSQQNFTPFGLLSTDRSLI